MSQITEFDVTAMFNEMFDDMDSETDPNTVIEYEAEIRGAIVMIDRVTDMSPEGFSCRQAASVAADRLNERRIVRRARLATV